MNLIGYDRDWLSQCQFKDRACRYFRHLLRPGKILLQLTYVQINVAFTIAEEFGSSATRVEGKLFMAQLNFICLCLCDSGHGWALVKSFEIAKLCYACLEFTLRNTYYKCHIKKILHATI